MTISPLKKAVDLVGSQVELAAQIRKRIPGCKVKQGHVWGWLNTHKSPAPPSEYCIPIEQITDGAVTRYDLRPDVFGENPVQEKAA